MVVAPAVDTGDVVHRILVTVAWVCCGLVIASFAIFVQNQLKQGSNHQVQLLQPGQNFHYRFTVLGAGPIKIDYTDAARQDHKATGPALREGNGGALRIVLANDGVHWEPAAFPHG